MPTARTARVTWRFTFDPPPDDWFQPGFDDSAWREGPGGFGTAGTPGAIIGTEWNTPNIWLRREFTWPDHPVNNPRLLLIYDEDPEIYLNGQLAAKLSGWATTYEEADLNPAALATLKPGRNLLAVRASQTYGGQSIDVGLAEDAPPLPVRKLFNHPVRDTSICLGPDRMYYLAILHAGHNMFFEDHEGRWWATFFGNDSTAPWRERPGILPIELGPDGRVRPANP